MGKRRKSQPTKREWTAFVKAEPRPNPKARDVDPDTFDRMMDEYKDGTTELWLNSHYTVHLRYLEGAGNDNGWLHLSIRHNDRKAVRDWRHFQRIKNDLAGDEREAIEIYPSETRLVDEANSYHLWVLPAGQQIPVGFTAGRLTGDADAARAVGARQRDITNPKETQ